VMWVRYVTGPNTGSSVYAFGAEILQYILLPVNTSNVIIKDFTVKPSLVYRIILLVRTSYSCAGGEPSSFW